MVNEELWNEAQTYGDIQVLPFVDYYSLITWKTLAICIYGVNTTITKLYFSSFCFLCFSVLNCDLFDQTSSLSAKYLMKTDDDAFVRVDEIQSTVKQLNVSHGLLYGRINSDSSPHRNPESKWYISEEVNSSHKRVYYNQNLKLQSPNFNGKREKNNYCNAFLSEFHKNIVANRHLCRLIYNILLT
jgi:hypothetical protein